ncbi:MAG TPA: MFS transporter, partial [Phycisphaerales bacterium]|nr:MFS transporter [Phycisphaerales bacterium]
MPDPAAIANTTSPAANGALAPLRHTLFRWLWIAALASNIGTWVHEVGAGWMMTELADKASPQYKLMVALVQAFTALPTFLLAIPAGALADVLDRRKLLITGQAAMLIAAAALAAAAFAGAVTPLLLLIVTFCLGVGAAVTNPAWQTAMTDLVPRDQLPQASALNSISLNLSRAIGPAIGGVIYANFGPGGAFTLNALSFVGIIIVLWSWRYTPPAQAAPGERFFGAVRAGVRYVRHSPPMRAVLVRSLSFVIFASSLWALMPTIASQELGLKAAGYGILLTCLGAGAVTAAFLLPVLRRKLSINAVIALATTLYAGALVSMALVRDQPTPTAGGITFPLFSLATMFLAGMCWLSMVTSLNSSAQMATPSWVRARALACYLAVFFGSMAAGSFIWGALAGRIGTPATLLVAASGMVAGLLTIRFFPLQSVSGDDLARSNSWEDPVVTTPIRHDDGPVVITVEYIINLDDADAFREAMQPVATTRYRDGAISWLLSRDTEDPTKWLEVFVVESWGEHLRQHARVTLADKRVQDDAKRFHQGPAKPIVRHFIGSPTGANRA